MRYSSRLGIALALLALAFTPAAHAASPFVPITPCRLVDSRETGGKDPTPFTLPLESGEQRALTVAGELSAENPCRGRIPSGITAIAANFTALNATADGLLLASPGRSRDHVAVLFFTPQSPVSINSFVLKVIGDQITLELAGPKADILVDVLGYYVDEMPPSSSTGRDRSGFAPDSTQVCGAASVSSVETGNGLMGGPITTCGTIDLNLAPGGGLSKTLGVGANQLGIAATPSAAGNVMTSNGAAWVSTPLVLNVKAFGAVGDGIANDTVAIQNTINAVGSYGGVVFFPAGSYKISSTLNVGDGTSTNYSTKSGIVLMGAGGGAGGGEKGDTNIIWAGSAGGTMLNVAGPIQRCRIENLILSCAGIAATGLAMTHPQESIVRQVFVTQNTGFGIVLTAYPNPVGTGNGGNNNLFENVFVRSFVNGSGGITIGAASWGSAPHLNNAQNTFLNCRFRFDTATGTTGIRLQFTDASTFINCLTKATEGLKVVPPSGSALFPQGITFYNSPIGGGVVGTGWAGLTPITFIPYPVADGEPIPTQNFASGVTSQGVYFGTMSAQRYAAISSSAAIANTTTETSFTKTYALPANTLVVPGARVRIRVSGVYSSDGTPLITLRVKIGGQTLADNIFATPLEAANYSWVAEGEGIARVVGASGSIQRGFGMMGLGGSLAAGPLLSGAFALNTSLAQTISVTAQWATASLGNTITLDSLSVEVLYPATAN